MKSAMVGTSNDGNYTSVCTSCKSFDLPLRKAGKIPQTSGPASWSVTCKRDAAKSAAKSVLKLCDARSLLSLVSFAGRFSEPVLARLSSSFRSFIGVAHSCSSSPARSDFLRLLFSTFFCCSIQVLQGVPRRLLWQAHTGRAST